MTPKELFEAMGVALQRVSDTKEALLRKQEASAITWAGIQKEVEEFSRLHQEAMSEFSDLQQQYENLRANLGMTN
jgi:hypothetical protein